MTYTEFLSTLRSNQLSVKDIAPILGYSYNSIQNNWTKNDEVPIKAEITLDIYLELQKIKAENHNLKKKHKDLPNNCNNLLTEKALKIASAKCIQADISLKDYLSSIIISSL